MIPIPQADATVAHAGLLTRGMRLAKGASIPLAISFEGQVKGKPLVPGKAHTPAREGLMAAPEQIEEPIAGELKLASEPAFPPVAASGRKAPLLHPLVVSARPPAPGLPATDVPADGEEVPTELPIMMPRPDAKLPLIAQPGHEQEQEPEPGKQVVTQPFAPTPVADAAPLPTTFIALTLPAPPAVTPGSIRLPYGEQVVAPLPDEEMMAAPARPVVLPVAGRPTQDLSPLRPDEQSPAPTARSSEPTADIAHATPEAPVVRPDVPPVSFRGWMAAAPIIAGAPPLSPSAAPTAVQIPQVVVKLPEVHVTIHPPVLIAPTVGLRPASFAAPVAALAAPREGQARPVPTAGPVDFSFSSVVHSAATPVAHGRPGQAASKRAVVQRQPEAAMALRLPTLSPALQVQPAAPQLRPGGKVALLQRAAAALVRVAQPTVSTPEESALPPRQSRAAAAGTGQSGPGMSALSARWAPSGAVIRVEIQPVAEPTPAQHAMPGSHRPSIAAGSEAVADHRLPQVVAAAPRSPMMSAAPPRLIRHTRESGVSAELPLPGSSAATLREPPAGTPAPPTPPAALSQLFRQWGQQLGELLRQSPSSQRVAVEIDGAEFGSVRLDVQVRNGALTIHVQTPDARLRQWLQQSNNELVSQLQKQGFGDVDLSYGQGDGRKQSRDGDPELAEAMLPISSELDSA